jgi:cullin-associated NEDD8-dissociated protein 1
LKFVIVFFRFKEREENVKADIFHAFVALLKQTKPSLAIQHHGVPSNDYMDLGEEGPIGQLLAQV